MKWLENNLEKRLNPETLFPGVQTIISMVCWYHAEDYQEDCGVSRYAVGRDYHKVVKKAGQLLIDYIRELAGDVQARVFVDSAPILEREWARLGGLGWIGKNGCLIQPKKGSWFFLGEILLDWALEPDAPLNLDLCGSCTRCIQACPTEALLGNGLINATRCISYQTIELKGSFREDPALTWENWIFGCDICQEVCPWNREPISFRIPDFQPRAEILDLKESISTGITAGELEKRIAGTPLKRAGSKGLMRNYYYLNRDSGQKELGEKYGVADSH